jgi:hypothetical protein
MIYAIIFLFIAWIISSVYFLRHLSLIIKELNELNKEQHQQNKDIMHLLKMNVEITKHLTNHGLAIQDVIDYIETTSSKKKMFDGSNIFDSPKGEA